jgi:hypothetical protein
LRVIVSGAIIVDPEAVDFAAGERVPGQLNENSLRDSSMGSRLMRVYRALVALALQAATGPEHFFFRRRFSGFGY